MELVDRPPAPAAATVSGRRNLLTVGLYRVACGAILFGVSLLLDLRQISIAAPYSFVTAAALYLAYGSTALWWIRRDSFPVPLSTLLTTLLVGDIFFLAMLTLASSGTGGPCPSCCSRNSRPAAGCCRRAPRSSMPRLRPSCC